MFRSISRRLAILNALVVIVVIAAVGLASYLYLERKIGTQANAELRNRSASAVQLWTDVFLAANGEDPPVGSSDREQQSPGDDTGDDDEHEDEEREESEERQARELVRSGDTIAYGIDLDGEVVSTLRSVDIEGLPKRESIDQALQGSIVVETITVEGDHIRLRSEPVLVDGSITGAIQVGMGLGPNERVLEFIRWATVGGILLGALLAIPSGWLLAGRSMQPIREAFARQQAFVADASHELRTPLTLIRAEAEFLQQSTELTATDRQEGESAIIREVDSMAGLVSSLLQLARIDERRIHLQGHKLDLVELVEAAFQRFHSLATERAVVLQLDVKVPATGVGDRAITAEILAILVDNALAYTPAGGYVTLRTGSLSGNPSISVADTGIGIDPVSLPRVFDRFYRADSARSRAGSGAGLGLSIANELAHAQQGRILVESIVGIGSTFTLILPSA